MRAILTKFSRPSPLLIFLLVSETIFGTVLKILFKSYEQLLGAQFKMFSSLNVSFRLSISRFCEFDRHLSTVKRITRQHGPDLPEKF